MVNRKKTDLLLFAQNKPKAYVSENFRKLRTNIYLSLKDHANGIVMITSAGPGEGKSTITANLGVVMAQAGRKVLLVDSDLRNPTMHKFFSMENNRGLTNLLVQNLDIANIVRSTGTKRLWLATSGPIPSNPSELLQSKPMKDFLTKALAQYDIVLLDVPPLISVTDAVVLAPLVDGVLLVVKSESTVVDKIKVAKSYLEMASANILGVVLNNVKVSKGDYNYYYRKQEDIDTNHFEAFSEVAVSKGE